MVYSFSSSNRGSKFLDIEFIIENINESELEIQLPSWRPGRYQLADFAKNIQKFNVKTLNNKVVKFDKITKDRWRIYCGNVKKIKITYNYYSNDLNAGSTWIDENQIYVNPVNCCFYVVGRDNESIKLNFEHSQHKQTAISLPKKGNFYLAKNFDELADSPFILSDTLQHKSYFIKGVKFNLWFQGECRPPWHKLLKDFKKFTKEQLRVFGSFPFEEYHFIYQILPYKAYHGVEHRNNTVISLGPGYSVFEGENYEEFLGVSSHELFHAWNVKAIRPEDMLPYDFTKENYTKMGYLTEGFTTYYGDLMLKRSGVFSTEQYLKQINKILERHSLNYGTLNLSVAESSFDTWLDGYDRGIPNRKSSIYVEGCLLAMITDLLIRKSTKNKKSLDQVMRTFFTDYAKKNKGINEAILITEVEKTGGRKFPNLWNCYFKKSNDYFPLLKKTSKNFDLEINKNVNPNFLAAYFGIYTHSESSKILFIAPNSPGFYAGLNPNDEIISINSILQKKDTIDKWAKYFDDNLSLSIKKNGILKEVKLKKSKETFFPRPIIKIKLDSKEKIEWF
jgi:predicted metalloprotease with PDZ domain